MTKLSDKIKAELWDIEIDLAVKQGTDPQKALSGTIRRWMWEGDLRPLLAAIARKQDLDQNVLNMIAYMIADNRLVVVHKRGRPKNPEDDIRNLTAAMAYEQHSSTGNSDKLIERIAKRMGMSHQSVRKAVTAYRKHKFTKLRKAPIAVMTVEQGVR